MTNKFARNITFLRKEKKLSQKQVAQDLSISQALLSHYEKGIRECGLEFVIKVAEYYNVSCDYLLGRTTDREYELSESDNERDLKKQSATQKVNRRLISSMLNVIYDYSATAKSRRLDRAITKCIMLELYRLFRCLYSANKANSRELFTVDEETYDGYAAATVEKLATDIRAMTAKSSQSYLTALAELDASPNQIAEDYPETAGEIFNVIHQAESSIRQVIS